MTKFKIALIASAFALAASPAFAHAELTKATPAAKSSGPAPQMITLHFSEGLDSTFSKLSLSMDGKPVALKASVDSKDDKTMMGKPNAPLTAGIYKVDWTSVAHDSHKLSGSYSFTVK